MSQFRKADSSVYTAFLDMIEKVFPNLSSYSFGLLYREKIKKSKGGVIMAEICQPSKLLSYFATNDNGNPFDFLIIVDEMVWVCANDNDRVRLMRHELRHIVVSEKGVAKLIGHDFQDFYSEVDLNADDPSWAQKLVEVTLAGYDQVKAGEKDPRNEPREGVTEVTKDPQRQTKLPIEDDKGVTDELRAVELDKPDNGDGPVDEKPSCVKETVIDIKAGTKKGVTMISELGKIRNKDGKIVAEEDDPEFLAGLEKGYGNA
jgi:hypothetical protein